MRSINLRVWFPVLTALLFGVMLLAWSALHYRHLVERTQQEQLDLWRHNLSRLQANISRELLRGETSKVQAIISSYATDPDLLVLTVVDEAGRVLLANGYAWRGQAARVLPGYRRYAGEHTEHGIQMDNAHERLFAILPLSLPGEPHAHDVTGEGHLYFLYDQAQVRRIVRESLLADLTTMLPALLLGILLVWYLFQHYVSRLLNALRDASLSVSEGRYKAVHFRGKGELALLAQSFNEMAVRVSSEQRRLRDSEKRLKEAQHVARMGYLDLNIEEGSITWSDETYRIFGFPPDYRPTLESTLALVHPDDAGRVGAALNAAIDDKLDYDIEHRIIRPDHVVIDVHAQSELTENEQGEVTRLLGTVVDITERKRIESELEKYREHLEEMVDERTGALRNAQEELVKKERLATLGQLTATVSHELRNPLGAMRMSLYTIENRSDKFDRQMQRAVERVDRNIDRCDQIINELLDFTRVSEAEPHIVRLDEWLESVIDDQSIPEGIEVEKNLSMGNIKVAIDAYGLYRAVVNVVDNACHAMLEGEQSEKPEHALRLGIKTAW